MKRGLLALSQHSNLILGELTYHQHGMVTKEEEECDLIARDLGNKLLMIMQNHGLLACVWTAREAFNLHYYLDMACKIQTDLGCQAVNDSEALQIGLGVQPGVPRCPIWPY